MWKLFTLQHLAAALSVSAVSPFVPPHERTSQLCMEWPHRYPTLSGPHSLSPTRLALRVLPAFFIHSHLVFISPKSSLLSFFSLHSACSSYRCGLFIRAKQQEIPRIFGGPELKNTQQKSRKSIMISPFFWIKHGIKVHFYIVLGGCK